MIPMPVIPTQLRTVIGYRLDADGRSNPDWSRDFPIAYNIKLQKYRNEVRRPFFGQGRMK
jgi:hypothetical protein